MKYRFGPFEIDSKLYELRRDGETIPLKPKAMDVLLHLIRHHDRVVPKRELLDTFWPGVTVSPNSLAQIIVSLRRMLTDHEHAPTFLQTVHTRGYRFIAPLEESSADSSESEGPFPSVLPFVGRETLAHRSHACEDCGRCVLLPGDVEHHRQPGRRTKKDSERFRGRITERHHAPRELTDDVCTL